MLCPLFLLIITAAAAKASSNEQASSGQQQLRREPIVTKTKYGTVEGEILQLINDNEGPHMVKAFRGIRYAAPPTGEMRFRAPQRPLPWTVAKKATSWPPACIQTPIFGQDPSAEPMAESEDCLFLNVFAPLLPSDDSNGYPVMVFIHGGGSNVGSTAEYGDKGITERIVARGVVFVGVQYRLGPYGFLSSGNEHCPGNWGFLDMVLALHWVRENIQQFGGDAGQVTIAGQSAGGAAATLLSISPLSRDLVHQVISMSGAATSPWSLNNDPRLYWSKVAVGTNCDRSSLPETLECLRKAPVEKLKEASLANQTCTVLRMNEFGPVVVDGQFLPKAAEELLKEAPPKPMLAGTTSCESCGLTQPFHAWQKSKWSADDPDSFQLQSFSRILAESVPDDLFLNAQEMRQLAMDHYLGDGDQKNNSFLFQQYDRMLSDILATVPQYKDAILRFEAGSAVWLYHFDYYNANMFPVSQKIRAAYHGSELIYLFDVPFFGKRFDYDNQDRTMLEILPTLMTNFVKFGNPTPASVIRSDVRWLPLEHAHRTRYLRLNPHPEMLTGYAETEFAFWTNSIGVDFLRSLAAKRRHQNKKPSEEL